jgi:hypothetical protein
MASIAQFPFWHAVEENDVEDEEMATAGVKTEADKIPST